MASSPKFVCFFFLLTSLLFSLQIHARDSHFFSKVSRNNHPITTTTTTAAAGDNNYYNNPAQVATLSNQEEQEEQPTFIPETETTPQYGLYGHETGLDTPATTTTTVGSTATATNSFYNKNENEKNYAEELKGLSGTTSKYDQFAENDKYFFDTNNNNNNAEKKYDQNYNYMSNTKVGPSTYNTNQNEEGVYNYAGAGYNGEVAQQGMSDTRYLENGKYFFDTNSEKKNYQNQMSYTDNYNKNYNNNGYYGNSKFEEYYNNNNNNNNNNNGNGMQEEEEFDFDP